MSARMNMSAASHLVLRAARRVPFEFVGAPFGAAFVICCRTLDVAACRRYRSPAEFHSAKNRLRTKGGHVAQENSRRGARRLHFSAVPRATRRRNWEDCVPYSKFHSATALIAS